MDFTQEVSVKIKKLEIYTGFNYLRDRNDEQQSFTGFYIGENFKINFIELQYEFFYKDYLKDYTYGSYKEFHSNSKKMMHAIHKSSNKGNKGKGKGKNNKLLPFNNNFTNKSQYDNLHNFSLKLNIFYSLSTSLNYSYNDSNIDLEKYEVPSAELYFNKFINDFNLTMIFHIERKRYLEERRKDILIFSEFKVEYYLNDTIFISLDLIFKNNSSTFNDENFSKFNSNLSIGMIF